MYIIAVNTTKADKIRRMNEYAKSIGAPAIFIPFTDIVGEAVHSAEEKSQDYVLNAGEKIQEAKRKLQYLIKNNPEWLKKNIVSIGSHYGFNEADLTRGVAKLAIISDDSGLEIFGENEDEMGFTKAFYDANNYDDNSADWLLIEGIKAREGIYLPDQVFPGTELVHLLGGLGGVSNCFRIVNDVAKRLGYNTTSHNGGKRLLCEDRCSFQWTVLDFAKLRLSDIKTINPKSSRAHFVHDQSLLTPNAPATIEDFLLATNGQTKAQSGNPKLTAPEARAIAVDDLLTRLNRDHTLAAGTKGGHRTKRSDELIYSVGIFPFHKFNGALHTVISGRLGSAHIKPNTPKPEELQNLMGFEKVIDTSDAYLFLPFENTQENRTKMLLALSYVIVHKVLEPEGKGKEIVVWEEDNCYAEIKAILHSQFDRGSFPDKLEDFIKFRSSKDKTVEALQAARSNYRKVEVKRKPNYTPNVPLNPIQESGKYNVAMFCSASLEGHFVNKTKDFCLDLFENDFGIVWGEGDRHMMGAMVEAKDEFIRHEEIKAEIPEYKKRTPYLAGSTTETIAVTETNSGKGVNGLNHSYRANNISDRMEYMYKNSHAFMIMEGGIGTTQELLGLFFCKQHQPDWVAGKPIIIHETVVSENKFMAQQIEYVFGSVEEAKKQGVYVVKTVQEGMEILKNHRQQSHQHLVPQAAKAA